MTLLLPRLHRGVPRSFEEDGSQRPLESALEEGVLKPDDKAADVRDFLDMAVSRIGGDEFGGSVYFAGNGMVISIYPPGGGIGNRINLAPIFAEVAHANNPRLIRWMAAVINTHPLICGPERWGAVLEERVGDFTCPDGEEVIAPKVENIDQFNPSWVAHMDRYELEPKPKDAKLIDALAPPAKTTDAEALTWLEQAAPGLHPLFSELIQQRSDFHNGWLSDRNWAVCQWNDSKLDPIAHGWDYECAIDADGGLGDSMECICTECTTWEQAENIFAVLKDINATIETLQSWKSSRAIPPTPSAVLS